MKDFRDNKMQSGLIFDVKRYAINDGPGIRTTVFLKGCPLHCQWCHNPESISTNVQKMYSKAKCIGCLSCIEVCPEDACTITEDGIVTDRALCTLCGKCAEICPTKATEMSGRIVTVDEIVKILDKERIFFDQSGGGVTFSGGEPLMQSEFLLAVLSECGVRGIHRTVDTTGFAPTERLLEVAKHTDHFLYDIKMMDSERHKRWTSIGNEKILHNLTVLAEIGASINIRFPFIKNVNDDQENIEQTAVFVAGLAGRKKRINILPYHNIAAGKYQKLGEVFDAGIMAEPDDDDLAKVIETFAGFGVEAMIGG